MYVDNGYLKTQKTQLEKRLQTQISDDDWNIITQKFESTDIGYTHKSVNKRLRKTLANRENGKKGGRPKKDEENPKNPIINPPLEKKVNIKENKSKDILPPTATLEIREKEFYNTLSPYVEQYGKLMMREFYDYWIEPNRSKTKMRFELEKVWDLKRRLNTWKNRDKNFDSKPKAFNAAEHGLDL